MTTRQVIGLNGLDHGSDMIMIYNICHTFCKQCGDVMIMSAEGYNLAHCINRVCIRHAVLTTVDTSELVYDRHQPY